MREIEGQEAGSVRIVISGGGDLGVLFARELGSQHELFVIEPVPTNLEKFDEFDLQVIQGSPTNLEVLKLAEVGQADVFIACAHSDEVNIISSLAAKQMGRAKTFCFVNKDHYFETFLGELGDKLVIDQLVWPEKMLAEDIARIISVPGAVDVEVIEKDVLKLLEFPLRGDHPFIGKKLRELELPKGVLVVAVVRNREVSIPSGSSELQLGDKVIFMGADAGMRKLEHRFNPSDHTHQRVAIIGGGNVGLMVARNLQADRNLDVQVIDQSMSRCQFLSQELESNIMVVHADASDIEFLQSHRISDCDCLVALTETDEKNLLVSLLAIQLKVRKVITRVTKPRNAELFEKVGVDVALSSRSTAIRNVVRTINAHGMSVMTLIEEGKAEILEIQVPEGFEPRLLKDMRLPEGIIIAAIRRKAHTIVPHGEDKIKPEDRLRVFCTVGKGQQFRELLASSS